MTLTAAAAATERLKVGTGLCLVIQRDTIQTAKLVASIDQVSDGGLLFGIGGGWNTEEMADHGTAYPMRFKKMGEQVEAVRNRTHRSSSSARLHRRAAGDPLWRGLDPARRRRKRRRSSRQRPAFSPDGRRGRPRSALFVCHGGGVLEYPDLLKRYRDLGIARVNFRCLPCTEMK